MEHLWTGIDHPESVAWSPKGYAVCGTEGGDVLALHPGRDAPQLVAATGGSLLGIAVDGQGVIFACDPEAGSVHRVEESGNASLTAPQGTLQLPNDCIVESDGSILVTDSGDTWDAPTGSITRIHPDGTVLVLASDIPFPNGISLSDHGRSLFVVETFPPRLTVYPYRGPHAPIGPRDVVFQFENHEVPDGVCVTTGHVYVTLYRPDSVVDLYQGRRRTVAVDPLGRFLAGPSNCCVIPGDGRILVANLAGTAITVINDASGRLESS